ncbi:hypothetical protein ACX93W_01695 [Paenibacillus sp. CAU 1782]
MENELNSLAINARNGCEESYHEVLEHFLPQIYRMSEYIWHSVSNETHFEQSCLVGIKDAIARFDPTRGNFSAQVNWRFRQALWRSTERLKKRRRGYQIDSLDEQVKSEEEKTSKYEVIDDLAIVDDNYLVMERIALLAEGDPRKLAILTAWTNGETNDSETASFLAKRYGGNSESHRKFILRFRTNCQKTLTTSSTA